MYAQWENVIEKSGKAWAQPVPAWCGNSGTGFVLQPLGALVWDQHLSSCQRGWQSDEEKANVRNRCTSDPDLGGKHLYWVCLGSNAFAAGLVKLHPPNIYPATAFCTWFTELRNTQVINMQFILLSLISWGCLKCIYSRKNVCHAWASRSVVRNVTIRK